MVLCSLAFALYLKTRIFLPFPCFSTLAVTFAPFKYGVPTLTALSLMQSNRLRIFSGQRIEFLRFLAPDRSRTIVRFPPVAGKIHPLSRAFTGLYSARLYAQKRSITEGLRLQSLFSYAGGTAGVPYCLTCSSRKWYKENEDGGFDHGRRKKRQPLLRFGMDDV